MLTSEQDLPALLAGLYGGVNDFGPLLQNRRTKQFCYQFGPRVSRLKHAGAASPFGHSLAQCAQKVHLGTVGDFCPKWEPAFGATAESAGAWYLLGSYLAGISLAKLRKKTVARGY